MSAPEVVLCCTATERVEGLCRRCALEETLDLRPIIDAAGARWAWEGRVSPTDDAVMRAWMRYGAGVANPRAFNVTDLSIT